MTEREILMNKISTYQFAIIDTQIYLDTHKHDKKALMQIREYREKLRPLVSDYEEKFGSLKKSSSTTKWDWINNPWPWDIEEDD